MSKMYSITGFGYLELGDRARLKARHWLDENPIEGDDGSCTYIGDWSDQYIGEHCNDNEYIFDVFGNPIHNIIEGIA